MVKINISPLAQNDLLEIKEYVTNELVNTSAAIKIVKKILDRILELENFPQMGANLSAIVKFDTKYRYLVCDSYLIFYRYEEQSVFVDRVLYAKRDYLKVLFGDLE
jgi:toxin ParE1/3/4